MVLHLALHGLTVILTVSTVLFKACTTQASGHCFPDINTGALSFPPTVSTTTALRQPIVIRGSGKKKTPANHHPPKARKWVISVSAIALLLVITLGTAFAVSPLGSENGHFINPIQLVANLVHNSSNN